MQNILVTQFFFISEKIVPEFKEKIKIYLSEEQLLFLILWKVLYILFEMWIDFTSVYGFY